MNAPFAHMATTIRQIVWRDHDDVARIARFIAEQSEGSLFHEPDWLHAVEEGTGQIAHGLIAEQAGEVVGWLPLNEIHSPIFGRALVSSGFAVGGGVLTTRDQVAEPLARAAQELAGRLSCPSVELRGGMIPQGWHVQTDSHCGFVTQIRQDDDEQLLAIPRKQRAEVRKGLKEELTIRTGTDEADRAAHYAVYAQSVHNLGTPVFPRSLFDAMLDRFAEKSDILTVFHANQPVASVLSFYYRGAVMPYWGGGIWAARGLRANDRMYFELMRHARHLGCTHFDFGRSKTDSGAWHFKKNWGFEPEPLSYASWHQDDAEPRDTDPNSPRYAARIALWKRLSPALANRLGPVIARGLG